MDINDLIAKGEKPELYEPGSAFMWTDDHISQQLLQVHLNPDVDRASRKRSSIEKTAGWILDTQKQKEKLHILDLGCGPGLYCELFAEQGHSVTGVDISKNSIEYAKQSAAEKKLDIRYIHESYLNLDLDADQYDLVVMIYTDLGVLTPTERDKVLKTVFSVLKKGGMFIFDVLKDQELEKKVSPNNWEVKSKGFWRDWPHVVLSDSFLYANEKVILFQYYVIDSTNTADTYRFWTHFFSQSDLMEILDAHDFMDVHFKEDVLPQGDIWNGDNVIFALATK